MATEEGDRLIENLRRLQLRHAANNLNDLLRDATRLKLGHQGFLARVVEAEVLARSETAANRRIRQAHFPEICRIEDYVFKAQPSLDRKQILDLAELGFLDRAQAVLFIGPSGVGKTHLAVSLGVRACHARYRVRYVRAYDMLRELLASLADDTLDDVIEEYCWPDLLIIDELGNNPITPEHNYAAVLFELVSKRHRRGAIVLATCLGVDEWPATLGTPSLVTNCVDRLLEGAHVISFPPDAPSYRVNRQTPPDPLPRPRRRRKRPGRSRKPRI